MAMWQVVSNINGVISFISSFISLFPQIVEIYRDKSVEGISLSFLIIWLLGDIASLVGALITRQLVFQIVLLVYFLVNDLVICGQYYYYSVHYRPHTNSTDDILLTNIESHDNTQLDDDDDDDDEEEYNRKQSQEMDGGYSVTKRINGSGTTTRSVLNGALTTMSTQLGKTSALPLIFEQQQQQQQQLLARGEPTTNHILAGIVLSWMGATLYIGSRLPQLMKNYQRQSTDGVSPFMFGMMLLSNITYNASIFTSDQFLETHERTAFIKNELPFIVGSVGTIAFDLIYFYQHHHYQSQKRQKKSSNANVQVEGYKMTETTST